MTKNKSGRKIAGREYLETQSDEPVNAMPKPELDSSTKLAVAEVAVAGEQVPEASSGWDRGNVPPVHVGSDDCIEMRRLFRFVLEKPKRLRMSLFPSSGGMCLVISGPTVQGKRLRCESSQPSICQATVTPSLMVFPASMIPNWFAGVLASCLIRSGRIGM